MNYHCALRNVPEENRSWGNTVCASDLQHCSLYSVDASAWLGMAKHKGPTKFLLEIMLLWATTPLRVWAVGWFVYVNTHKTGNENCSIWVNMQREVVISYRFFRTTHRSDCSLCHKPAMISSQLRVSYRKSWATIFCKVTCFIIDKPNTPP